MLSFGEFSSLLTVKTLTGMTTDVYFGHLFMAALHMAGFTLRLYSRVSQCEFRKIEVYCIDFSRPSPVSKFAGGIHYRITGLGAILCRHFEKSRPKSESTIGRYRAEAALNGLATDRRTSFTRRFRAVRVRHASIRPNLSRPRGVGPK